MIWLALMLAAATPQKKDGRIVVAIMDLEGAAPEEVRNAGPAIAETLERLGAFRGITTRDLQALVDFEQTKQLVGCSSAQCVAELGNALGSAYVIIGSVSQLDNERLLQLQLNDTKNAKVVERVSRRFTGSIFVEVKVATELLVRDVLKNNSGKLALALNQEGATVRLDGSIVGTSPLAPMTVSAGRHTLSADKEGFIRQESEVLVPRNETLRVRLDMLPSEETRAALEKRAALMRGFAYGALSLGAFSTAGAVTAIVLGGKESATYSGQVNEYNSGARLTDERQKFAEMERSIARWDGLFIASTVVGVASVAAGVLLLVLGDSPSKYAPRVSAGTVAWEIP